MLGLLEDAITPLWSLAAGGCHPNRDIAVGFEIEEIDRFAYRPLRLSPKTTHILGRARASH